jgi:hypothetical protein
MTADVQSQPPVQPPVVEKVNPFQRIAGVFIAPVETFQSIARRPDVLVPLIIQMNVSLAAGWMIASRVDFNDLAHQAMESNPRMAEMPREQADRMIRFTASTMKVTTYVSPILSLIGLLIIAGGLLLGVRAMGGEGNFKQAFSVATYGWYPRLIKSVISLIVLMNRKSITIFDLQDPVRSNLGFLFDPKTKPLMFALVSSFDIFALWSLALYVIGFSAISRLSRGKTAAVVLILWLVVCLLTLIGPAMQSLRAK